MKNKPRKDGSGKGTRKNRGRGGCFTMKEIGQGRRLEEQELNIEGFKEIW